MNLIGELALRGNVTDVLPATELNGAWRLAQTNINGTTYYFVAGFNDDGLQVVTMSGNGTLTLETDVEDSPTSFLNDPYSAEVVEIGNRKYLLTTGSADWGVTSFRIETTGPNIGQLTLVDTIDYLAPAEVRSPRGIETFETSVGTLAAVASSTSDSVTVFRVAANGTLTEVSVVLDNQNASYRLDSAYDVSIHTIGNKTFLYALSSYEGVTVFSVANNGNLTFVDSVAASGSLSRDIFTGTFNGRDLLLVPDSSSDILNIFEIGANGVPTLVAQPNVRTLFGVDAPQVFDIITIDGVDFLVTVGTTSDSVALFSIDESNQLTLLQSITDPQLNGASDVEYTQIGNRHFLVVTAFDGDQVTSIEIGLGADALTGTSGNDRAVGLNGDDDLVGRAGNDWLNGGIGDDVLSGGSGNDSLIGGAGFDVLVGGVGNDSLEGGANADVLIGGGGTDTASYANSSAGVTVSLQTNTASGGDATGDVIRNIENLTGSRFSDVLTGDGGQNRILGGSGNDTIAAGNLRDVLIAGGGNDSVLGENGNDLLNLGGGNDVGIGGNGNDRIIASSGNDRLEGGAGNDDLRGGGGRDTIAGGTGNDTMRGDGGPDFFVFEDSNGQDVITDFDAGTDKIDLSAVSGVSNFGQVTALQLGSNAVIIFDSQNTITLNGVNTADLSASDFIF